MANNTERTTTEHPEPLAKHCAPPLIATMIRTLVQSGKRAEMIALFEHRTTYNTIKGWRTGRRKAPQWAIDICTQRLAQHGQLAERGRMERGASVKNVPPNILTWNARQKEKSRDPAAL